MKIRVIVDSSCAESKQEIIKKDWLMFELPLFINNKKYVENENITSKDYYKKIKKEDNLKTSCTPIDEIISTLERESNENDYVIVYPISKKISSQYNNLVNFSSNLNNVFIIESYNLGYAIIRDCENGLKYFNKKKDIKKTIDFMNRKSKKNFGLAIPWTLDYLIKGGRISHRIASFAKLLNIYPIIAFKEGELIKYKKTRNREKGWIKICNKIKKNVHLYNEIYLYHANNPNVENARNIAENIIGKKIPIKNFPLIIVNHTGPNIIGLMLVDKKEE